AIAPLEALGCKLNRGQGVLDLMRDAPCNIRPRRLSLIDQLPRDVLERDDVAFSRRRDLDRQRLQFTTLAILDHAAAGSAAKQRCYLRRKLREFETDRSRPRAIEQ